MVSAFACAPDWSGEQQFRKKPAVGVVDGVITRVLPARDIAAGSPIEHIQGTFTSGFIDTHMHMTPWMGVGLLAARVATVGHLGNDVDQVSAQIADLGDVPLPSIYWSGPLPESDTVNWPPISRGHDTTSEIRETVSELADRGFRTIKLYFDASPDQAHRRGMRVLGHV